MTPPKHWEKFERPAVAPEPQAKEPPKFIIRKPPPAKPTPWPVWAALGSFLLLFAWMMFHRPDAQFVRAQRLVADFERGKAAESINYRDPVYDEALGHLRGVSFVSGSASAAARMTDEILQKRRAFADRLKESQARMDAARADQEARASAVLEAQRVRTGTDPEAAARLTAEAPKACHEERRRRSAARTD